MPYYRAFVIGPEGHVIDRYDLTATDEEAAREQAQGLSELPQGYDIELWHLDRKIATFKAKHLPSIRLTSEGQAVRRGRRDLDPGGW